MTLPVFIGDEVTAAGYRLAGLRVTTPEPAAAAETLERARREEAAVILLTAAYAAEIPEATLHAAMAAGQPPVVVVPDAADRVPVPDLAPGIRAGVGLE